MDAAVADERGAAASAPSRALTVAIAGFGAIGQVLAKRLDAGIPGLRLVAVASRNTARVKAATAGYRQPPPVESLARLAELADIVVECLPAAVFLDVAEPALRAGRTLVVASVGQLLAQPQLKDLAIRHGGRIVVPTGALIGLDAVHRGGGGRDPVGHDGDAQAAGGPRRRAASRRQQHRGQRADGAADGVQRHGARGGEGVSRQRQRRRGAQPRRHRAGPHARSRCGPIPRSTRNTHTIVVEADSAQFSMTIENVPSEENPRTGKITALSVVACLRKLASPLRIGT